MKGQDVAARPKDMLRTTCAAVIGSFAVPDTIGSASGAAIPNAPAPSSIRATLMTP